ncbi:MAG: hypothetical protein KAG66_23610, partial [Methylococcales bacterium]|nr:hypothetical protein [Methylococcales bacterium]
QTLIAEAPIAFTQKGKLITGAGQLTVIDSAEPARATLMLGEIPIATRKIALSTHLKPTPQVITAANFGDEIMLIGFDQNIDSPAASTTITLYWQAQIQPTVDYTRFIHFLDAEGAIIVQSDQKPAYPTGVWAPAEVIDDTIILPFSDNIDVIVVGWYHPQTVQALLLPDGSGRFILPR